MKNISLSKPDITALERASVLEVLNTPNLSFGPKIEEFESKMARFIGTQHAIAVNSGTSALHLSVISQGIKDGDEVITAPNSFIASASSIALAGAGGTTPLCRGPWMCSRVLRFSRPARLQGIPHHLRR